MKVDWRDTWIRAAKTAVQTLFATVTVQVAMSGDVNAVKVAAISAVAAGAAVVWNAVLSWSQS